MYETYKKVGKPYSISVAGLFTIPDFFITKIGVVIIMGLVSMALHLGMIANCISGIISIVYIIRLYVQLKKYGRYGRKYKGMAARMPHIFD